MSTTNSGRQKHSQQSYKLLTKMFLLMLHYVLIYLLDHLFLDDGATFCFNF